ncbi:MAG: RNA-processing protein [Archaeoglobaceae archaeon]|nr:RNA-processing protein [Archaeoglobaceae archaeon]MDW8118085.1 RNA-processing protein [Archaeoglobaceae archaeon]
MRKLSYNLWFGKFEEKVELAEKLKESFKSARNTSPLPFNISDLGIKIFGKDYYKTLRKIAIQVAEEKVEKELGSDDKYVIALVKALEELEEVINTLKEKKEDLEIVKETEIQDEFTEVLSNLERLKGGVENEIEAVMERIAPNLAEVAGAKIGAKLIERFGSLENLAKAPASKIQIIGAEKSLYKALARLKKGKEPKMPKHGIIFMHGFVRNLPKSKRGKMARFLAGKISIASKIDFFRGELEEGLYESVKNRFEELRRA